MLLCSGCQKEKNPIESLAPSEAKPTGKREYGEIKPVVLPLPPAAVNALAGTDVYNNPLKEVQMYFRVMTLVVYRDRFDVKDFLDRMAIAFNVFALTPVFSKEADSWTIQVQARGGPKFVTMTCTPKQVNEYVRSHDVASLLTQCDFMMINDMIISKPEERLDYYYGRINP